MLFQSMAPPAARLLRYSSAFRSWAMTPGPRTAYMEPALKMLLYAYGLSDDGIAGPKTLAALGLTGGGGSGGGSYGGFSESDVQLLAKIISAESRGEPYQGQVAVGAVIMNRIAHPSFPNTLSGVIYQEGAFSCLYDGGINAPVADSAYQAAREAINGSDPTGGAIYYYNPAKTTNKWIWSRQVIAVIGAHNFAI